MKIHCQRTYTMTLCGVFGFPGQIQRLDRVTFQERMRYRHREKTLCMRCMVAFDKGESERWRKASKTAFGGGKQ